MERTEWLGSALIQVLALDQRVWEEEERSNTNEAAVSVLVYRLQRTKGTARVSVKPSMRLANLGSVR